MRARDPAFDMVSFLESVKADVPALVRAYLSADAATLSAHCSKDMVERVVRVAAATPDAVPDPTVLDVGELELVDLKFLDGDPAAIIQFSAQHIKCARDRAVFCACICCTLGCIARMIGTGGNTI